MVNATLLSLMNCNQLKTQEAMNTDDYLQNLTSTRDNRPVASVEYLINALMPLAVARPFTSRSERLCPRGNLYLLRRGSVSYCRDSDNMMAATLHGPAVVGLMEHITPTRMFYLRTDNPAETELWQVAAGDVERLLSTTPELWQHVAVILAHVCRLNLLRDEALNTRQAWDAVRGKLLELMMAPAAFRAQTLVADYLCESTSLSRTTVLQMLRELRQGKYISTRNGRLVSVSRLPDRY